MNLKPLASIARTLTGKFLFRKRLPAAFGGSSIFVTSRSDIRLLAPGFEWGASDLLTVAKKYINTGDCVWDIGSNLGIFSFCSAYKAGPQGSIYSLEADPFFVEIQHRTSRSLPNSYAPVSPLCAAIANRMGLLKLAIPKNGLSRNHLSILSGNSASMAEMHKQVVTVTADFLLDHWPSPDFVKVDIEGAELLFLQGADLLLKSVRPTFYIEVNPENQSQVTELFRSYKYGFYSLDSSASEISEKGCCFNAIVKPERV